jgi:hypothetical protein
VVVVGVRRGMGGFKLACTFADKAARRRLPSGGEGSGEAMRYAKVIFICIFVGLRITVTREGKWDS